MFTQYAPLEKRLARSFLGRRGRAVGGLRFEESKPGLHRVTDGTGYWIEYDTAGWRIRWVAEGSSKS